MGNARSTGSASQYYGDNGVAEIREACGMDPKDKNKGRVRCLKCEKHFESEDRFRIRVCPRCKQGSAWQGAATGDDRYPADRTVTEFKKKAGKKAPNCATKNARKHRASFKKKKGRSKLQKEFTKAPRAKKRTRA